MFPSIPEKFAFLYESDFGQRIWAFLTCPKNVIRLEAASELDKPAIEGIEEPLFEEFGEAIRGDHVMQMVDLMVQQILEQRDWVLHQSDENVHSVPLRNVARYRRPDWISFYVFRNASEGRDFVITDRLQDVTLPVGVRWAYYATVASPLNVAVMFGIGEISQLREHVHSHGYQRMHVEQILRAL